MENSYISDGIEMCSKCHTPREKFVTVKSDTGNIKITYKERILCQCEEEEYNRKLKLRYQEISMAKIEKLRAASLMDKRFYSQTFDKAIVNESNQNQMSICKNYVENFDAMLEKGCGLLFTGEVGTGKTYAAACIANALIEKKFPVVMTSFVKLIENVLKDYQSESSMMEMLDKADLLILDDLGAERKTEFALEKVYNIIDRRYRCGKPMILTTNIPLEKIKSESDIRYKRVYDRIIETVIPVQFSGSSLRRRNPIGKDEEIRRLLGVVK